MNIEKLSKRLEAVSEYIPIGSKVADIGSDHAYLPCYAVKNGIAEFAIAGEVVEGPYQSALQQVNNSSLSHAISVRKGDGLEVIEKGEVDCITIAGMGGALITSILNQGIEKLSGVQRLILQPNIAAISIRTWCIEHGWKIIAEQILEEDQKIYEILVLEPINDNGPYTLSDEELLMGPMLIKEKNNVFQKKWHQEVEQWKRIIKSLDQAVETVETTEKKNQLQKNIRMVEEVIS
ncbi:SAM-dependent methyltransferase [Heyndrickxia shackletonii]|uniref:SAM-dependent methyltransferase n=1 Tax=Heyndrickxia shackletonii TaxID=157838 RepID=A0A0Q3TIT8_9BACI|nr:tRNA (adenine(22)-N(1))-methyltransferase TrmK [Heyndrickxia shackletonii]KQL53521.1 SAM-dependent methyltransferase [Heyndrickxia shackletonii]NEY99599.1 tRNA (adenine-N(1))-methyltransferase [Heyndrickxia shackletonii]